MKKFVNCYKRMNSATYVCNIQNQNILSKDTKLFFFKIYTHTKTNLVYNKNQNYPVLGESVVFVVEWRYFLNQVGGALDPC